MSLALRSDFEAHWRGQSVPASNEAKAVEARAFLRPVSEYPRQAGEPWRILDVGCGDGVHAEILAQADLGIYSYYGLDLSHEAICLARRRVSTTPGTAAGFSTGDALFLPYRTAIFDVVFSYGVLAYTGAPDKALAHRRGCPGRR